MPPPPPFMTYNESRKQGVTRVVKRKEEVLGDTHRETRTRGSGQFEFLIKEVKAFWTCSGALGPRVSDNKSSGTNVEYSLRTNESVGPKETVCFEQKLHEKYFFSQESL